MSLFAEIPIEKVASYWNSRPCNLRHSPAPVGTREYFDGVEARKYFVEPHIPAFADFSCWSGKRVLEIGCGIGTDTINFARAGAEVTAVDLSEKSLELARLRASVYGLEKNITFIQANAEQLAEFVAPAAYDLIYSFGVIHHTPEPRRVIEQVRKHFARPGSVLKIMVYHRHSTKVGRILAENRFDWRGLDVHVARHSEAQTGCPVTYTYTPDSLERLLEGFTVQKMFVDHIFPFRIDEYIRYRYVKAWPWRGLPQPALRWFERRFGWHLCVTAVAGP